MLGENAQIQVVTDGNVQAQWRAWSHQGKSWLTVIVKATFTMTPGGTVVPTSPVEVALDDRTFGRNPTRSVEIAAEAAPFLGKCDVLLTGHAYGGGRASAAARLAVYRDRAALLDRTVHVFGERDSAGAPRAFERIPLVYECAWGGPGVDDNPLGSDRPSLVDPNDPKKPACFAPVSRFWPARKRLCAGLDVAGFFGAPGPRAALPETLSGAYFQAAPAAQQVDHLRGDEWLVLDGMSPSSPRIQTQLLGARAGARVRTPGGDRPAPLVADMLIIDADRLTCSVVWRGRVELSATDSALSTISIAAGLDMPGRPIGWDRLVAQLVAPGSGAAPTSRGPEPGPSPKATAAAGEATLGIGDGDQHAAALRAVAPFAIAASRVGEAAKDASATPWAGREAPAAGLSRPSAPSSGAAPGAPLTGLAGEATLAAAESVGESTLGLSAAEQAASSSRAVAPFSVRSAGAPASSSLAATPWSGSSPAPLPVAAAGEMTLDLGASRALPAPIAVPPPALLVESAPIASVPVASVPVAPAPLAPAAPAPASQAPAGSVPVAPVPVAPAPVAPAPALAPVRPSAAVPARPPAREPPSLSERLFAAGAGGDDIAALMRALNPPPPPPLPDDD